MTLLREAVGHTLRDARTSQSRTLRDVAREAVALLVHAGEQPDVLVRILRTVVAGGNVQRSSASSDAVAAVRARVALGMAAAMLVAGLASGALREVLFITFAPG